MIVNANAGSTAEAAVEAAGAALPGWPARVEVAATGDPDELGAALAGRGRRRLVVVGGDGSIQAVVRALRDRGELATVPVGIVPLGTGNDLARGLGLPLDPAAAAAALVAGTPHPLDLVVDDGGGVVVNVAHAGLGASAAEAADDLKPRLGALAYPVGALLAGARESGWSLQVEVDGRRLLDEGTRVLLVGVGNGRSIGGGTPLCPDAVPDDGLVDVVVALSTGPAARVAFGAALRTGRHVDRDDVVTARGREVRITGELVGHNADGEISAPVAARTYVVEPGAWSVLR
jgi:YegS/Rv2252/BmrU family lipid kinase